ncbi:MAG: NifB/NifX family molybdenum-iron cluster-binding protein [Thermoanaerobacterales bacterium]|nr:NifB/NifX family molybdenum-iron cluster-binding protein [Bacillota bacterium]MDI6906888.1 NifB/NifX family molybdenum-iron cluster-binding protein [Thermoanaerobacterales bacterium]
MRVAVSATGSRLTDRVDPRFGRCSCFVIYDTESGKVETLDNSAAASGGGAGVQASQAVAGAKVDVVLTGNLGPNAYRVFETAGIKCYTGCAGTVEEAIKKFTNGELEPAGGASVGAHHGIRR